MPSVKGDFSLVMRRGFGHPTRSVLPIIRKRGNVNLSRTGVGSREGCLDEVRASQAGVECTTAAQRFLSARGGSGATRPARFAPTESDAGAHHGGHHDTASTLAIRNDSTL